MDFVRIPICIHLHLITTLISLTYCLIYLPIIMDLSERFDETIKLKTSTNMEKISSLPGFDASWEIFCVCMTMMIIVT